MKEERKEKNNKESHRECRLEHRSTPLSEASCADCVRPRHYTALCGQGSRGGLPEGLLRARLRSVPPAQGTPAWGEKGHPV